MIDENSKTTYKSYLLRLWSGEGPEGNRWRASLENPQTGERMGFSSLERLFSFLADQTGGKAGEEYTNDG